MDALELKIPPPLVALLVAVVMWGLALSTPAVVLPTAARVLLAAAVALVGGAFSLAGLVAFRKAKTTVNPLKPEATTSAPASLLGPILFVAYIGRFRIKPEERALAGKFSSEFAAYQARVRRWL